MEPEITHMPCTKARSRLTFQLIAPLHTSVCDQEWSPAVSEVLFLLLEGFTHLAFAGAVEPLRLANEAAGREIYRWRILSPDGGPVTCSGLFLIPDGAFGPVGRSARLVVVGGLGRHTPSIRLISLIRRAYSHGAQVVGVCGGVLVLVQAGLLENQDCAIHWQLRDWARERFPDLNVTPNAFVLGRVPTAAGGTAAADLMLHMISGDQGSHLAAQVADLMIHGNPRDPDAPQTIPVPARLGVRNPQLLRVLMLMEQNIEHPLGIPELACRAGVSVRQVERLFARFLDTSPNRHYVALRLERARRLLMQSDLSIVEIALACGFDAPAHFRRHYREHFGISAHQARAFAATGAIRGTS